MTPDAPSNTPRRPLPFGRSLLLPCRCFRPSGPKPLPSPLTPHLPTTTILPHPSPLSYHPTRRPDVSGHLGQSARRRLGDLGACGGRGEVGGRTVMGRARWWRWRRPLTYRVVAALVACGALAALLGPRVVAWVKLNAALQAMVRKLPFRQTDFDAVVTDVEQGKLAPDTTGAVTLPPRWAHLTQDGNVYLSQTDDGNVLMTFVTWRGRHFNFEGYMHSARALREDALATDSFIRERGFVGYLTMRHPGTSYHPPDWEPAIDPTEELSAAVERRIEDNWYFISYRLD